MGTSFDCHVHVQAHTITGLLIIAFGPLEMGNLAELVDWMQTDEFRDGIMTAASKALTMDCRDVP